MRLRLALPIAACSLCAASHAIVLRVPTEYPSIQAAIDVVQLDDTVLVASGTYVEALTTPFVSFSLIGESRVDSLRPVIDPSTLPDSPNLSCLNWNGASCNIESFVFRNGPEMYPRPLTNDGGVFLRSYEAVITNCLFDSTNAGLHLNATANLFLTFCKFSDCVSATVGGARSRVEATACEFKKQGLQCGSGSSFVNCVFDSISPRYVLNPVGDLYMESCIVDHHNSPNWPTIDGGYVNATVLNCIFRNSSPPHNVLFISHDCAFDMLFDNNLFENITPSIENGRAGINWACVSDSGPPSIGGTVTIRNNTFINSLSERSGKCIVSGDPSNVILEHNRFINISGTEPTVTFPNANVFARDNIFINTTYAMSIGINSDARYNYWGDPTGPYNAAFNPNGLGDEVSDFVWFYPWYTDTLFLDVPRQPTDVPEEFTLSVYPNPFNNMTRLSLFAPTSFVASIELINVLGQRAREIYHGPVLGQKEFSIIADNLPSGIYFLSVRDVVRNSINESQKLALIR